MILIEDFLSIEPNRKIEMFFDGENIRIRHTDCGNKIMLISNFHTGDYEGFVLHNDERMFIVNFFKKCEK